jgi:tripartite-type tricarboxylate transporter receptor subunit TctC
MTPAEFDAYLRKDIDKWAQVVKAGIAGVTASPPQTAKMLQHTR